MIYTGIGSRETPEEVLLVMAALGELMAKDGHILRSGGAPGADLAFERGADVVPGMKEIFLPWLSFNEEQRQGLNPDGVVATVSDGATEIARQYHPAFGRLSHGARKLMARNTYQVLGLDLATPTDLVVCWTYQGKGKGGTGQALRIAQAHFLPIIDIGGYGDLVAAIDAIEEVVDLITR